MINRRTLLKTIATLPPVLALQAEEALAQAFKPQPGVHTRNYGIATQPYVPLCAAYNDVWAENTIMDPLYRPTIVKYYNEIIDGAFSGMRDNLPAPGQYNFTLMDRYVKFGTSNNLKMSSSNLIWHGTTPEWVKRTASPSELDRVMRSFTETMMKRYQKNIRKWVVVNEPVAERPVDKNDNRKNVYQTVLGEKYIHDAYRNAHQIDPTAKLIINEYDIESYQPHNPLKLENFRRIIFGMLDKGVPFHGVGIQAHLLTNFAINAEKLQPFLEEIKKAKLEVYITELDINDHNVFANNEMRDIVVAAKAFEFLKTVYDVVRPAMVTTWGFSDKDTWLNMHFKRKDNNPMRPLPFDSNFQPKLFYKVLEQFTKGYL